MSGIGTESAQTLRTEEHVVLLDDEANPIGSAEKRRVHTDATPLHLAFSCYLFDQDGAVLVTRRALSKSTWPGVWTNSFCGHPGPGESIETAIMRRARQELGADIRDLRPVNGDFRYLATDANGIVDNEVCPVYRATIAGGLSPHPDEVGEWAWVSPASLTTPTALTPFAFSPWLVLQLPFFEDGAGTSVTSLPAFGQEHPG